VIASSARRGASSARITSPSRCYVHTQRFQPRIAPAARREDGSSPADADVFELPFSRRSKELRLVHTTVRGGFVDAQPGSLCAHARGAETRMFGVLHENTSAFLPRMFPRCDLDRVSASTAGAVFGLPY
jgi:hypothetical protein